MANDFTGDPNALGLYNMDQAGGILLDSLGGVGDMVNFGGAVLDVVNFKQGDASGKFVSPDALWIQDHLLPADFPLKDGTSNGTFSLSFWFRSNLASMSSEWIISKWYSLGNERSFLIFGSGSTISLYMGYNGGSSTDTSASDTSTTIVRDRWYHIGITWDDSDQSWRIRIYDAFNDTVGETTGTNSNGPSNPDGGSWTVGGNPDTSGFFDGWLDEVVIFKDVLTADEIDEIREGTYGTGPPPGTTAKVLNVIYETDTTGVLWYAEAEAVYVDDDVLTDVGENAITVNGESVVDPTYFPQGEVIMLTGDNAGERRPVLRDVGNEVVLMWPFPNELQAGDEYTITPGCNKTTDHCDFKFDNALKFRGFKYIPRIEESIT
jgi:hypothetical protein